MDRLYAPLFDSLRKLADQRPASFHVPGHRYGSIFGEGSSSSIEPEKAAFQAIMQLDVTELSVTDDLHHPEAAIAEAQQLAAACFGAEETCFLVGGSTSGNLALLLGVCDPGDIIIVQRNVHKSVINGLKLAGARAVFIMPQIDERTSIATLPSLASISQALAQYPEAKAVFLTNPNYYGMSVRLRPYSDLIHEQGKILLVDEAHGAHYGFHPLLPESAIQSGADAVVQSTHKTLTALTMGAMLHMQGERLPRAAIRQALATIQSSSPSFPIMASLDISRAMIERHREKWFEPGIQAAAAFRNWLAERNPNWLTTLYPDEQSSAYNQLDPLRILITDITGNHSGFELQRLLEEQGCWAEMADPRYVVLVFGIQTSIQDVERLMNACIMIEARIASHAAASQVISEPQQKLLNGEPYSSSQAATEKEAEFQSAVLLEEIQTGNLAEVQAVAEPISFSRKAADSISRVRLAEAAGRCAAEMVVPYPPGIPVLYAGERITEASIRQINHLAKHGAKFQGASDPSMQTIEVQE
ncbi:aminotransferase class I/II-fold pyridoxal phosphate-dependent enzyme [Paenibacillus gorillae]|uniref:aminotransferase class I/II-fold pyridoxal phosphate-dependent enzyme n=1 Tax=Paenibacillus gorillae TaxID=1243662 RepID=UPI0004B74A1C|nr:aminotransferase class I/II-fold pyridoxal phosphate-dependent enzyme [Paenibacillus gorillae]